MRIFFVCLCCRFSYSRGMRCIRFGYLVYDFGFIFLRFRCFIRLSIFRMRNNVSGKIIALFGYGFCFKPFLSVFCRLFGNHRCFTVRNMFDLFVNCLICTLQFIKFFINSCFGIADTVFFQSLIKTFNRDRILANIFFVIRYLTSYE